MRTSRPVMMLVTCTVALTMMSARASEPVDLGDRPTGGTKNTLATGGIEHVANIPYTNGSDIEFTSKAVQVGSSIQVRDYAFVGRLSRPVGVIDITNPRAPVKVADIPCSLNQNDVQVWNNILVMAADGTGTCTRPNGTTFSVRGFATADISDPRAPKVLGFASIPQGAHNLTVHPTEPIVYVSNSDIGGVPAQVHIWDISNPAAPVLVRNWLYGPVSPPHDITFNANGTRAYAASVTHNDIFDTTDPRNPALLTTWTDPAISISHQADPTPDGRYLIVSDELGGGVTGPVCPGGGLHVYDLTVERAPVKVGIIWSDTLSRVSVCTAHVFRINPDGKTLSIAWYNDGTHVIDFEHLLKAGIAGTGTNTGVGAKTVAAMKLDDADTWSSKMWQERHPGYVFANDLERGFDVFYVPALV